MIKSLLGLSLFASASLVAPPAVQETKVTPIEVTPTAWTCPDCSPEEKYVLAKIQEKTKISDRNALATILVTLNKRATSVPMYAKEGLEFLTTIAIVVVMGLFSGPQ